MKVIENSKKSTVDFAELDVGNCFKDEDGDICIKTDFEQDAVALSTGTVYGDLCGKQVTPVNAEVRIIN